MKRQAGDVAGPLAVEGVPGGVPIPISGSISGGNAAASATGSAVPADADYQGVNVGGTLRGVTGVNPTGSVFAEQVDIASIGGNAVTTTIPVSGSLTVSGTVAATQSTSPWVVGQGTATNLKTQAENYQGGVAVGAAAPLQVTLANTGANATPVAVSLASAPTTSVTQGTSPWIVAGGGTAGSAATGVATIQGIASMTPVQVSQATASNLNATVTGTGSAGTAASGVVTIQGIASMTAVQTTESAPTAIFNGKKTVTTAGTRVTLAASTTVKSVTIKALAANTGIIYVGDTSVASTNGFALAAGESVSLDIANLNTVNLDSSINGEGVTYLAVN